MVEHEGQTFVTSKGVTLDEIEAAADYFERKRRGQGPAQQIADFSQPLIDAAGNDPVAFQNALSLGSIFWNLAVCKEESVRKEMLEDLAKHTSKTEEERRGFRALAMMMIDRHQAMFPEMHG